MGYIPHKDLLVMDASLRNDKSKARNLDPSNPRFVESLRSELNKLGVPVQAIEVNAVKEKHMTLKKGQDTWTCSITFKLRGVPGKSQKEAIEAFRKWIGNQLRDASSKIRKEFFKLVTAEKEK